MSRYRVSESNPWNILNETGLVLSAHFTGGFQATFREREEVNASARRAVDCLNACEGVSDPVEAMAKAKIAIESLLDVYLMADTSSESESIVVRAREALALLGGGS